MRVLFSSTGGDGHLLPLLPLAGAFVRRGDEVAFASPPGLRHHVEGRGFELIPTGPDVQELGTSIAAIRARVPTLPAGERRAFAFSTRFGEVEAPRRLEPLRAAVERWAPGLLVHESADLAAPIAAREAGVRAVDHAFGLPIPDAARRRAERAVEPLLERVGVRPPEPADAVSVEIAPPSLAGAHRARPGVVHPLRAAEASGHGSEPGRARPFVYVTLGTVWNTSALFRLLLDAFAPLACDVLVTAGRNLDLSELEPIPSNARIVDYVPQAEVLPRCDVVVSHGGSGTLLGALAHGRPLVLLPQGADQFDNAAACAACGVAETLLPPGTSLEAARAALERVLAEPRFAAEARRVAGDIAAMPSPDDVAARLAEGTGGKPG